MIKCSPEVALMGIMAVIMMCFGFNAGRHMAKSECTEILSSRLPVPPVPIIYLSREE